MKRHMHAPASRAPVAPMHRGPQAHTPGAHGAITAPMVHAPNAALLIDFDNVTMGIRSDLQTELRNLLSSDIIHGKVAVQRAYADWRCYPQYIVPLSEASIDLIFAPGFSTADKITDISHKILTAMRKGRDFRLKKAENDIRLNIVKTFTEALLAEDKIDKAARQKIRSQKREILEGSEEFDLLHKRYYAEEMKKLGIDLARP